MRIHFGFVSKDWAELSQNQRDEINAYRISIMDIYDHFLMESKFKIKRLKIFNLMVGIDIPEISFKKLSSSCQYNLPFDLLGFFHQEINEAQRLKLMANLIKDSFLAICNTYGLNSLEFEKVHDLVIKAIEKQGN